eukprot:TRINITY_DN293_c0_g1_i4.p1 TRINITY_DN293_c0_g1~~TRINITY_DN293_c0_g1_i4.p1  ORF type:complete len:166 (+),score=40.97 TRINITY_DN293_c0_g1_i4:74-571(+)
MSKVPDFGWSFDVDNHGSYIKIHENRKVASRINDGSDMANSLVVVNYSLSNDLDEPQIWKINIKGGVNARASAFGIIETEIIDHEDIYLYKKFYGWGTNISRSNPSEKEEWISKGFNLSYYGTLENGGNVFLKFDPNEMTLSCSAEYHSKRIKDMITDIPLVNIN